MLKSKIVYLKQIYKFGFAHFLEKRTVSISIKETLLKIKSCSFRPKNARYGKMLKSKIVYLKEIYNFDFDYLLIKRTVFVLIKKTLLKIKSCGFRPNNARYEKMLEVKLFISRKSTILDFDHFLIKRTVFVLIV